MLSSTISQKLIVLQVIEERTGWEGETEGRRDMKSYIIIDDVESERKRSGQNLRGHQVHSVTAVIPSNAAFENIPL